MSVMRKALLAGSQSIWLREKAMRWSFVRRSVSTFMPGERVEDALEAAQALKGKQITTILTRLGESLAGAEDSQAVADHYVRVMDMVAERGLDAQISVKPTQLAYDQDKEMCFRHLTRLLDHAKLRGNMIWIDMESSEYVDGTIALFKRGREYSDRIGIALQAYLYRTEKDVEDLLPRGCAIRLVKGAYLEPPAVAYPDKKDVDENFHRLAVRLLQPDAMAAGTLLHMATHDMTLVDRLRKTLAGLQAPKGRYEFAMLFGIQRGAQQQLVSEGQPMRVLISYGEYWFPWYMRRLAERPANVWFVVKNMFS
ncbi:MAG: proline dehydrogenase family protein [Acidobacteriota bacterium]|nr:proline dehydrogenase family protein [Acidobacteriota bacterium]